jgi:hypothetical protein
MHFSVIRVATRAAHGSEFAESRNLPTKMRLASITCAIHRHGYQLRPIVVQCDRTMPDMRISDDYSEMCVA